jgi:hypothetical protein
MFSSALAGVHARPKRKGPTLGPGQGEVETASLGPYRLDRAAGEDAGPISRMGKPALESAAPAWRS